MSRARESQQEALVTKQEQLVEHLGEIFNGLDADQSGRAGVQFR